VLTDRRCAVCFWMSQFPGLRVSELARVTSHGTARGVHESTVIGSPVRRVWSERAGVARVSGSGVRFWCAGLVRCSVFLGRSYGAALEGHERGGQGGTL